MGYRKHHPRKPSIVCTFFTSSCVIIGQWTNEDNELHSCIKIWYVQFGPKKGLAPVVFLYTFVATFEMTCGELLHAHSKDSWWYVYIAFRSLVFFGCGVILEYRLFFCWHGRNKKLLADIIMMHVSVSFFLN